MKASEAQMTATRWQALEHWLAAALTADEAARAVLLRDLSERDATLHREVQSLLAAEAQAELTLEPLWSNNTAVVRLAGQMLGAYRLVSELGRGGMGSVWLAERDYGNSIKRVAVKLLKHGVDSDEIRRRFAYERQILAQCEHPNIAHLIDAGTTSEGQPYLVMELIEGLPIDQYCRMQRLNITKRLELFQEVCRAVAYAHGLPVVHRDLKPSNILVTNKGVPKLLDFGIAKLLQPGTEETQAGQTPMTPAYASPEQRHGAAVTTASDVYSLGVILYELLTSTRAFPTLPDSTGTVEIEAPSARLRHSDLTGEAFGERQLEPVWRRVRGDLDHIVLRALSADLAYRYGTVADLLADLDRHLTHRPVQARNASLSYRATKFIRRYKYAVVSAALVLATLCGGIVATAREAERARAAQHQAEQALTEAQTQRQLAEQQRQRAEAALTAAETEKRFAREQQAIAETQRTRANFARRDAEAQRAEAETQRNQAETASTEAVQQRSKAERRFADVRQLANALLFDLFDAVKAVPGTLQAQHLFIEKGTEYLNKLTADANGDIELEKELAAAFVRLGQMQKGTRSRDGRLGDTPAALVSFQKAATLYESLIVREPDNRKIQTGKIGCDELLANTLLDSGQMAAALPRIEQAVALGEKLTREQPDEVGLHLQLLGAYRVYCSIALNNGRQGETPGMASYIIKQAVDLGASIYARHPENKQVRYQYANMLMEHGYGFSFGRRILEARTYLEKSQALLEGLLKEEPANGSYQRAAMLLYDRFHFWSLKAGDAQLALASGERCLALTENKARLNPDNVNALRDVSLAHERIADALYELRRPQEALPYYQHLNAFNEAQSTQDPLNTRAQRDVADGYTKLAICLLTLQRTEEALGYLEKARTTFEGVLTREPQNRLASRQIVVTLSQLARLRSQQGKVDEARKFTQHIFKQRQQAVAARPTGVDLQHEYAQALLTAEPIELRNVSGALSTAKLAVELSESRHPRMLLTLAQAYQQTSEFSLAQETAQKALAILPPRPPGEADTLLRKDLEDVLQAAQQAKGHQ